MYADLNDDGFLNLISEIVGLKVLIKGVFGTSVAFLKLF